MLTKAQLIAKARTYLLDALNVVVSDHTRYSSAMSSIHCLWLAGAAEEADAKSVELWETKRYEVADWPTADQVSCAVRRVLELLEREQGER